MKKGFTLLELIAVIIIIAMLSLTVFPLVMNQLQSHKNKVSDATLEIIKSAADLYVTERKSNYPTTSGKIYCDVTLKKLVEDDKIKSPIKDFKTGKEVSLSSVIKVTVNSYLEYEYELVEANKCVSN